MNEIRVEPEPQAPRARRPGHVRHVVAAFVADPHERASFNVRVLARAKHAKRSVTKHQVPRASIDREFSQSVRVPRVLVPGLDRLVLRVVMQDMTDDIRLSAVGPVVGLPLRAGGVGPIDEEAQLRVLEPLWCLVLIQRLPRRFVDHAIRNSAVQAQTPDDKQRRNKGMNHAV